jgi:hypothetical protein
VSEQTWQTNHNNALITIVHMRIKLW